MLLVGCDFYIGFAGSVYFMIPSSPTSPPRSGWTGFPPGATYGLHRRQHHPFVISIVVLLIMGMDNPVAVKFSVVITSVWWLIFSIPILKNVKQTHYIEAPASRLFSHTFHSRERP